MRSRAWYYCDFRAYLRGRTAPGGTAWRLRRWRGFDRHPRDNDGRAKTLNLLGGLHQVQLAEERQPACPCAPGVREHRKVDGVAGSIRSAVARAISWGSALRSPLAPAVPDTSSVLVKVGRTVDSWTPDLRYSCRAASVNPMTANLVPQ